MIQNSTTFYHISHYIDHCDVKTLVNLSLVCKDSHIILKKILDPIKELSESIYIEFTGFSIKMYKCVDIMKIYGLKQYWPQLPSVRKNYSSSDRFCFPMYPERLNEEQLVEYNKYMNEFQNYKIYDSAIKNTARFIVSSESIPSNKVYDEQCNCHVCNTRNYIHNKHNKS
jgi:hypothetical protein